MLAMTPDNKVNIIGVEDHIPMLRREIPSPNNDQVWMPALQLAAERDGLLELGARHDGHPQNGRRGTGADALVQTSQRVILQVAVYNAIAVLAF